MALDPRLMLYQAGRPIEEYGQRQRAREVEKIERNTKLQDLMDKALTYQDKFDEYQRSRRTKDLAARAGEREAEMTLDVQAGEDYIPGLERTVQKHRADVRAQRDPRVDVVNMGGTAPEIELYGDRSLYGDKGTGGGTANIRTPTQSDVTSGYSLLASVAPELDIRVDNKGNIKSGIFDKPEMSKDAIKAMSRAFMSELFAFQENYEKATGRTISEEQAARMLWPEFKARNMQQQGTGLWGIGQNEWEYTPTAPVGQPAAPANAPVTVQSVEEAASLPVGAKFIYNGQEYTRK